MIRVFLFLFVAVFFCSCAVNKNYSPARKYAPEKLKKDFTLLQTILEKKHPSLYWYTPKDSIDAAFRSYYSSIKDSMTEQQFAWRVLAPMVAKIHCGHTSILYSKDYSRWAKGKKFSSFPLYVKVWNDTMAVTGNLNRKDSLFKWGTLITSVNGVKNRDIISKIFTYLPMDGYAENVNYIRMSSSFPRYHGNIYGLSKTYTVGYIDSASGQEKFAKVPLFEIKKDTTKKDSIKPAPKEKTKKLTPVQRREKYRTFEIDSSGRFATMTLNSFTKGNIRAFFRQSFKKMDKNNIPNLIIDLRVNGGGRVGLSTLLTKYISRERFKLADTVYSQNKFLGKYRRYISGGIFNDVALFFMTKKQKDGNYHIGRMERKLFHQKNNNHYDGKVYVLTNGATFSASTVFSNAVKGQEGIKLVGEETGGGWYGNNGIIIPNISLPNTGLRVRLPLFRLVQWNHTDEKGAGIPPDISIPPSYKALLEKKDNKMERVKEMIFSDINE